MLLLTTKKKFIRNLTILTLGMSLLTYLMSHLFFLEQNAVCYLFIPLCFYVFGLLFVNVFTFVYQHDEGKVLPVFLVCRGIKFFLSLTAVAVCGLVARRYLVGFGLVLTVYYLVYLVFETYFFFRMESELKVKK